MKCNSVEDYEKMSKTIGKSGTMHVKKQEKINPNKNSEFIDLCRWRRNYQWHNIQRWFTNGQFSNLKYIQTEKWSL